MGVLDFVPPDRLRSSAKFVLPASLRGQPWFRVPREELLQTGTCTTKHTLNAVGGQCVTKLSVKGREVKIGVCLKREYVFSEIFCLIIS